MRRFPWAVAVATCALASGAVQAQEGIESNLNASIRLGLQLDTQPDAELSFQNYGSRIRWNGSAGLDEGLKAISYIELGFDQQEGVNDTRHAWVGVEGDFGTVKGGKQYTGFYDAVSSTTDIAYWSSCYFELACDRVPSVIKFSGPDDADLQFMASTLLVANDPGNDFVDGLDFGVKLKSGDMTIGAGGIVLIGNDVQQTDQAGNPAVDQFGNPLITDSDTGFGLGISASIPVGEATASATLQFANDDFLRTKDNAFIVTGAFAQDRLYALFTLRDADNTPFALVAGYRLPVVDERAFIYFEAAVEEPDVQGQDTNLLGRAVFVFDFDVLNLGA